MKYSSGLLGYDAGSDLVLTDLKEPDAEGNRREKPDGTAVQEDPLREMEASGSQASLAVDTVVPAFGDWLYERSDLWCAGNSVQHEVYARLFGSRAAD